MPATFHEIVALLRAAVHGELIVEGKRRDRGPRGRLLALQPLVDERNARKVWSDPRAHNYYWTGHGRSAVMCPFYPWEIWHFLRHPSLDDLVVR